jgi:hypothetical protein
VWDDFFGIDVRSALLFGEIIFAYSSLMIFAFSGGIRPQADLDEFFVHLSKIARHVVFAAVGMYLLRYFPNETSSEICAFYTTQGIGLVYIASKIGVAAQIAIMLNYNALFEPERYWAKVKDLEGIRLFVWFAAMWFLLNPFFVSAPKELRSRTFWLDISREAEGRALDRKIKKISFVSKYNRNAERFFHVVLTALGRRSFLKLVAAIAGTVLMIGGIVLTQWLRRTGEA